MPALCKWEPRISLRTPVPFLTTPNLSRGSLLQMVGLAATIRKPGMLQHGFNQSELWVTETLCLLDWVSSCKQQTSSGLRV